MPKLIQARQVAIDMFDTQKWVLMIRDNKEQPWRPFGNKISGRPFVYGNLDKAIYAKNGLQASRNRAGNTKLIKAEHLGVAPRIGGHPTNHKGTAADR